MRTTRVNLTATTMYAMAAFFLYAVSSHDAALRADPSLASFYRAAFGADGALKVEKGVLARLEGAALTKAFLEAGQKSVPWAVMEGLDADSTARVIWLTGSAMEAGFRFEDAEDLIPAVARRDMTARDFVLCVRYYVETSKGRVPEQARQLFLSRALERRFDGLSILAGGRGLLIARSSSYDVNKAAKRMLRILPGDGFAAGSDKVASLVRQSLPYERSLQNERFLTNLNNVETGSRSRGLKGFELKQTLKNAGAVDADVNSVSEVNLIRRPHVGVDDPADPDFIHEHHDEAEIKKGWQDLSEGTLAKEVKDWLGVPYLWGGETKKGVDCTGLTREVLAAPKIGVPRNILPHSGDQARSGNPVAKNALRTGDLIFFSASPDDKKITHAALAMSSNVFVHARVDGVRYDKITDAWWSTKFVTARRIFNKIVK